MRPAPFRCVLTFEMLSGQAPWDSMGIDDNPMGQLLALRESYNQVARDFIKRLLMVNPQKRLGQRGAEEVKSSGWFKSGGFTFKALIAQEAQPPYQPPPATYSEAPMPKPAQASRDSMSEARNKLFVKSHTVDDWARDF
ncbi:cAMP-dependent protein kinase catalytic subunit PRKX [Symbiodinium microadriaticum]|uniref:cAMP-dependent protein kinase catalytic subunit PRKX n=1 Tax=Symbiodinium microadriaticum TaxID=2951 RepID=A0A1Q9DMI5_SYMMI|nr:cAMP-dependent protein kinase catalytic subunit PRKX [Symbiodinium microadriaticum]